MRGLEQYVIHIIYHYGYIGLFGFLSLGMIGLPVPDELLMTFSGFQTSEGRMNFLITLSVAAFGSFLGMNLSYWIGRLLGTPFLNRIGPYLHLNPEKINNAEEWFQRFGAKIIVVGYFFPGFRHLMAYFAGISKLSYRCYALLSGTGAVLWSLSFISLGRLLGKHWREITLILHRYLIRGGILLAVIILLIFLFNLKHGQKEKEKEQDKTG